MHGDDVPHVSEIGWGGGGAECRKKKRESICVRTQRIFGRDHRRPKLCAARSEWTRSGGRGATLVRGHHDVFAAASLGSEERAEGWRRGPRRTRPHGPDG